MQHLYSSKTSLQKNLGARFSNKANSSKLLLFILSIALLFGMSLQVEAQIMMTAATGGTNLPVDRAANSTNPVGGTWTSITDIFITETIKSDFSNASLGTPTTTSTNTIYIDAPSNWTFNTSAVSARVENGGGSNGTDISIQSGTISSTRIALNVTFDTNGNNNAENKVDRIVISGLQVKAVSGTIAPSLGYIMSSIPNTGSLGTLSQATGGTVTQIVFSTQPTTSTYGSAIAGFPTIQTRDQFGNPSTVGLGATLNVTLTTTSGTGTLTNNVLNIGTSGGNGTATFTNLLSSTAGAKVITAAALGYASVASSSFLINPKVLTITGVSGVAKVYDGGIACALSGTGSLVGIINGDVVTLASAGATGSFADRNVGTGKSVTTSGYSISGTGSGNYIVMQPTVSANITPRALTVSGILASNKEYDGLTACAISGATLENPFSGDVVTLVVSGVTANFNNKNVGYGKPVALSGLYTLSGVDAANYSVTQPVTSLTANITPKTLTITGLSGVNKVYDKTTDCALSGTPVLSGVVGSEAVTLGGAGVASFADKKAETGKAVTISGFTLSGTPATLANYVLVQPVTTANITKKLLRVDVISENKKDSNGDPIVNLFTTDKETNDVVSLSYASAKYVFDPTTNARTIDVTGIAISGPDADNYALQTNQVTGLDPLPVTLVSFTGKYSHNIGVTLNWSTATEKDNAYFQVERSIDGKNFASLGKVKGHGNSSLLIKYQFVDGQSLSGTVYYRLRQVDVDGTFEISKVIAVNSLGATMAVSAMKAYPNPTLTGKVALEPGRGQGGAAIITLTNGNGQILSKQEAVLVEGQPYELDLTQQKSGMYYLQVENAAGRSISRVVKQ